jgi:ribosomal-protein-serine acetyltransferase
VPLLPDFVELNDEEPSLRLQRWHLEDAEQLLELTLASYDELHEWLPWATERPTLAVEEQFLQAAEQRWQFDRGASYAVIPAGTGPVGTWGLFLVGEAELGMGYWLNRSVWGNGYATRATAGLVDLGFSALNARRVLLEIDRANVRSEAVAQRVGFQLLEVVSGPPAAPAESGQYSRWAIEADAWHALSEA